MVILKIVFCLLVTVPITSVTGTYIMSNAERNRIAAERDQALQQKRREQGRGKAGNNYQLTNWIELKNSKDENLVQRLQAVSEYAQSHVLEKLKIKSDIVLLKYCWTSYEYVGVDGMFAVFQNPSFKNLVLFAIRQTQIEGRLMITFAHTLKKEGEFASVAEGYLKKANAFLVEMLPSDVVSAFDEIKGTIVRKGAAKGRYTHQIMLVTVTRNDRNEFGTYKCFADEDEDENEGFSFVAVVRNYDGKISTIEHIQDKLASEGETYVQRREFRSSPNLPIVRNWLHKISNSDADIFQKLSADIFKMYEAQNGKGFSAIREVLLRHVGSVDDAGLFGKVGIFETTLQQPDSAIPTLVNYFVALEIGVISGQAQVLFVGELQTNLQNVELDLKTYVSKKLAFTPYSMPMYRESSNDGKQFNSENMIAQSDFLQHMSEHFRVNYENAESSALKLLHYHLKDFSVLPSERRILKPSLNDNIIISVYNFSSTMEANAEHAQFSEKRFFTAVIIRGKNEVKLIYISPIVKSIELISEIQIFMENPSFLMMTDYKEISLSTATLYKTLKPQIEAKKRSLFSCSSRFSVEFLQIGTVVTRPEQKFVYFTNGNSKQKKPMFVLVEESQNGNLEILFYSKEIEKENFNLKIKFAAENVMATMQITVDKITQDLKQEYSSLTTKVENMLKTRYGSVQDLVLNQVKFGNRKNVIVAIYTSSKPRMRFGVLAKSILDKTGLVQNWTILFLTQNLRKAKNGTLEISVNSYFKNTDRMPSIEDWLETDAISSNFEKILPIFETLYNTNEGKIKVKSFRSHSEFDDKLSFIFEIFKRREVRTYVFAAVVIPPHKNSECKFCFNYISEKFPLQSVAENYANYYINSPNAFNLKPCNVLPCPGAAYDANLRIP